MVGTKKARTLPVIADRDADGSRITRIANDDGSHSEYRATVFASTRGDEHTGLVFLRLLTLNAPEHFDAFKNTCKKYGAKWARGLRSWRLPASAGGHDLWAALRADGFSVEVGEPKSPVEEEDDLDDARDQRTERPPTASESPLLRDGIELMLDSLRDADGMLRVRVDSRGSSFVAQGEDFECVITLVEALLLGQRGCELTDAAARRVSRAQEC